MPGALPVAPVAPVADSTTLRDLSTAMFAPTYHS